MWLERHGMVAALEELDGESFAQLLELVYDLVRGGCEYHRAIRLAVAQVRTSATSARGGDGAA